MAAPKSSIGGWTPAELQAFIQNIAKIEPASLPLAMRPTSIESGSVRVLESLDFDSNAVVSLDGTRFDPQSFIGIGETGNAEPMFGEHTGTGAWRAAGGSIIAQVADLPDQTDENALVNKRLHLSMIYVPTRRSVSSIHAFVTTAATGLTVTAAHVGLWTPAADDPGDDNIPLTVIEKMALVAGDFTAAAGFRTWPFTQSHVLEAGIYYAGILLNWSAATQAPKFASKNANTQSQNSAWLNSLPRTGQINVASGGAPDTGSSEGPTSNRTWFGLSS